jgi:hypothetical protein
MVKITPLKLRRMALGLRQVDITMATGISPSRYSAIENELALPGNVEWLKILHFFTDRELASHPTGLTPLREVPVSEATFRGPKIRGPKNRGRVEGSGPDNARNPRSAGPGRLKWISTKE